MIFIIINRKGYDDLYPVYTCTLSQSVSLDDEPRIVLDRVKNDLYIIKLLTWYRILIGKEDIRINMFVMICSR